MKKKYLSPSCDAFYFEVEEDIMEISGVDLPVDKNGVNEEDANENW